MEAVKTQDIGVNDLNWIIEYKPERCTMCGSCVASCSFGAIKAALRRQDITVSEENTPAPVENTQTETNSNNSRKDNEDIARKDLKMYYPNETPYKGY